MPDRSHRCRPLDLRLLKRVEYDQHRLTVHCCEAIEQLCKAYEKFLGPRVVIAFRQITSPGCRESLAAGGAQPIGVGQRRELRLDLADGLGEERVAPQRIEAWAVEIEVHKRQRVFEAGGCVLQDELC